MERKHWEADHPAVMSWAKAKHKRSRRYVELSVAERRRQVVERVQATRPVKARRDWQKIKSIAGLTLIVGGFATYDRSESAGESVYGFGWVLLGMGMVLIIDAIRRCD